VLRVRRAQPTEFDDIAAFCAGRGKDPTTRAIKRRRRQWLQEMESRGLKILVALESGRRRHIDFGGERVSRDELTLLADGLVVGILEYLPIEETLYPVEGRGYFFVDCIWVLPPFTGSGVGRALMEGVIRSARQAEGGVATVAWRGANPADDWPYMPEGFFRRFGFEAVEEDGNRVLMAVSYGLRERPHFAPVPRLEDESVTFLCHPSCPASMWAAEEVREIAAQAEETKIVEVEGRKGARRYGALFGVCAGGRVAVNRLASADDLTAELERRRRDRPSERSKS
jgi:ribosomal protein S18 acetylase RimI-like enzyme